MEAGGSSGLSVTSSLKEPRVRGFIRVVLCLSMKTLSWVTSNSHSLQHSGSDRNCLRSKPEDYKGYARHENTFCRLLLAYSRDFRLPLPLLELRVTGFGLQGEKLGAIPEGFLRF